MARDGFSFVPALTAFVLAQGALAQTEGIFVTVPDSPLGLHLEFANVDGAGAFTEFEMFGAATHADTGPPPALHTLVIVFEWRIAPGVVHDETTWGESPDMITTVVGGTTNPFATGVFTTPGAWDTVAVHMYAGFPITVSAEFRHRWVPAPGAAVLLGLAGAAAWRRRRWSASGSATLEPCRATSGTSGTAPRGVRTARPRTSFS